MTVSITVLHGCSAWVIDVCRAELQRKIERSRQKQQEIEEELRRRREALVEYMQQVGGA